MSPRKGDAPARATRHSSGPPTTGPTRATSATRRGARSRGQHQGASDRQPRHRQQGAGREPAVRRRQRLRRCRGSDRRAEAAAALRECSARVRARPLRRGAAAPGALGPRRSRVVGCARAVRPDALPARRVPQGGASELEEFRTLSGSTELNAVLADCYRALHRWTAVADLWNDLREASPDPAVVADGRIVMAGALADQGKLTQAIALLERSGAHPRQAPAAPSEAVVRARRPVRPGG